MKNSKIALILCMSTIILGSCGKKDVTTVCSIDQEGMSLTYTMVSNGDKLKTSKMVQQISLEAVGLSEEEFQTTKEEAESQFKDVGIDFKLELKEGNINQEIGIDYEKTSMADLQKAGFISPDENGKTPKSASLKKLKKVL